MKFGKLLLLILIFFGKGCSTPAIENRLVKEKKEANQEITVLGIAQDAGYPQINCNKSCCIAAYEGRREKQRVTSLGMVDKSVGKFWIFEASPDFPSQLQTMKEKYPNCAFSGLIITHAHIGHYSGLLHLGREAWGAKEVPIYVLPRMANFLRDNGPWSLLVELKNINIIELKADESYSLSSEVSVTPFLVPHRDEFSETAGFKIETPAKSALFIPDIDKWEKWDRNIVDQVKAIDYAFLDATFYDADELPGRNMSEIPHPFVEETMRLFESASDLTISKVYLIHFNHTNPLMDNRSKKRIFAPNFGFQIVRDGLNLEM